MKIHELLEVTAADSFLRAAQGPKKSDTPDVSSLKAGIKKGYEKTKSSIEDLPYTKLGKASKGFAKWATDVNRGFRR